MAKIGTLTADLTLESAAFIRNMEKAQRAVASNTAQMTRHMRQVEAASRSVQRAFNQLRVGAAALAGALAVRQFQQFTKQALDAADALAKTADAVGMSTTALQEYRAAASLSGVSTQKFDGALEKLTRSIGDARNGTGALVTALKDSDKALLDQIVRAGSTEQALDLLFRKLAQTGSEFDRNALAAAAFGRSGVALVNMVRDGTAGLEDMRQAAVDMGLVLEESLIRKAEEVNDRMELLKGAFQTGFQRSIIQGFADSFQLTKENIEAARVAGENFGRLVGTAMRAVAEVAQFIGRYIREITSAMAALIALKAASMFLATANAVVTFGVALVKAARAGVLLDMIMSKSIVGVLSKIAVTVAVAAGTWEIFGREAVAALNATEDGLLSVGAGVDALTGSGEDKVGDLIATLQRQRDETKRLADAQRQGAEAVELVTAAIQIENAQRQAGVIFTQEQTDRMLSLILATNRYRREIQAVIDAEEDARRAAEEAAAERARAMEEQRREMARRAEETERLLMQPFENFLQGVQSALVPALESVFSGGVKTFSDLFRVVKQLAIRFAAEMAALMVFRPQVVSGLGGIAGVSGMGGSGFMGQNSAGGGLGSLFGGGMPSPTSLFSGATSWINGLGASLGFAGPASAGAVTAASVGPGAIGPHVLGSVPGAGSSAASAGFFGSGATLSGTLGAAGLGAFAGSMIASLIGGNQTGGAIGGGLGAGIGFAVGGPIGGLIGGGLGSLAGSLFGPGKSVGPNAAAVLGVDAGRFMISGSGADNGANVDAVRREANKAAAFLNQLAESLDLEATKNLPRNVRMLGFGDAARGQRSAEQMVTAILQAGGLTGGSANLQAVLRGSTAANVEENIALLGSIPGLLMPAVSAFDQAMKAVNDNFDKITAKAEQFGIATELIAQARERELAAVEAQARAPFLTDAANIVDFLNAQALSPTSSGNPASRLAEAQRQFGTLLERVRGGEAGLSGALTQAAGSLLGLGRENFASSVSFAGIESFVRSSLLDVAELLTSEDFFDAQVEATRQQTEVQHQDAQDVKGAIAELKREIVLLRQQLAA